MSLHATTRQTGQLLSVRVGSREPGVGSGSREPGAGSGGRADVNCPPASGCDQYQVWAAVRPLRSGGLKTR